MESRKIRSKKFETSNAQAGAIALAKSRGLKLASSHPEIAARWQAGTTEKDLGGEYCPTDSEDVARNAIHYALKMLLPQQDVRASIAETHIQQVRVENGKAAAARHLRDRTGIWAMSPEKRRLVSQKSGRKTGKKMGRRNYRLGLGIAKLTVEQLREQGKKAAISRGFTLYDTEEKATEFGLSNEKDYIIKLKLSNSLSWIDITRRVNNVFGNNRKLGSIRTLYNQNWRKTAMSQHTTA